MGNDSTTSPTVELPFAPPEADVRIKGGDRHLAAEAQAAHGAADVPAAGGQVLCSLLRQIAIDDKIAI